MSEATEPKKSKIRSPNHPLLGLDKAIEMATTVEKMYGMHEVPLNLAHKLWKYKEWSSVADQLVAALKSYGLIKVIGKGKGRKLVLTDSGSRISRGAPDKEALIRTAFTKPSIHREIIEHFGAKGLPNDALLEQYLVWGRPEGQRFNQETVGAFIERFRKSLEFSKATVSDIIGGSSDDDDNLDDDDSALNPSGENGGEGIPLTRLQQQKKRRPMSTGLKEDVYSLDQGAVVVQWPERIQGATKENLDDWLKLVASKLKRAVDNSEASSDDADDDESE